MSDVVGTVGDAVGSAAGTVSNAAADVGGFLARNRGTLATLGAIGVCLTPGIDLVGCGFASAGAYALRAQQRIEKYGFRGSLGVNGADLAIGLVTLGTIGAAGAVGLGEAADIAPMTAAQIEFLATQPMWQTLMVKFAVASPDIAALIVELVSGRSRGGSSNGGSALCAR